MKDGIEFDASASRRIEAAYLTADVVAQRVEVLAALDVRPGERVLDIGSGPGLLAESLAAIVGSEGRAWGIDTSEPMLEMARRRCESHTQSRFDQADASKLPYPDASFDAVVSTQVYEYVEDVERALSELWRVLRHGGRALILDTDWDSLIWNNRERDRMKRVLEAWDEHLCHPNLPQSLTGMLKRAGFQIVGRDIIPMFNPEFHENSYSAGILQGIEAFVPGRNGITEEDAHAWSADLRALGEAGEYFFSVNRYLFVVVKPGRPSEG